MVITRRHGLKLVLTAMAARPGLAAGEPFKIGVVASLTGGFAAATADEIAGVQAWAKARGVPGRTIAFETLDDETNPVNALNVFRRLAGDPAVPVIFALVNSNSAMAMKSVASEFKVPIVAGGSLGELGVPPDPWLFKVPPSPRDQIVVLCQYAQKKGYKRLASLHAQDGFGQAESKSVRELAPKAGLEIVEMESCGNDDTNVTPQITRIRAANPDIIYIGAVGRPGILALKTAQQMKITAPIAVQQAAVTKSLFDALGGPAAADGILTPSQIGAFGGAMGGDTARLYAELERAMGRKPVYLNTFGYDVGLITEAAVQDSDGSRAGIRDALERLKDLPALNGPVTFTAEDHTGQDYRSLAMAKLANGALVPAD